MGERSARGNLEGGLTCRFGFIKYKTVAAANAALEQLGGKEMADFPGQSVRLLPVSPCIRIVSPGTAALPAMSLVSMCCLV